jgi:hypothetical protein
MMRRGFGLITAIMFIVLVATIGALALSFSAQSNKQTFDIFAKAQAELLARSATEYALLAISGHEITAATGCLNDISGTYGGDNAFKINVYVQYIGATNGIIADAPGADCRFLWKSDGADVNGIFARDSDNTVLLDTIVELPANSSLGNPEPIRIHRRTLQKP